LGDWELKGHVAGALLIAMLVLVPGCGAGGEVAEGATASIYVAGALCPGAIKELERHGGEAGGLKVRAICLPDVEAGGGSEVEADGQSAGASSGGGRVGKLKLSQIGANARRATEDSTTIGYIGEPTAAANRFSAPILEAADIPQLSQTPGAAAMAKLLQALEKASGKSGSLRQSVLEELR
jgi:hypothetical protein